jgi:hypothetical protein
MAAAPLSVREIVRAVRHLAAWADHHTGGGAPPSRRPASLTYYASSENTGTREPAS